MLIEYTELIDMYFKFVNYASEIKKYKKNGYKCRMPNFPEHISENIIRIILNDETCIKKKTGDLYSALEGLIECKTFTSSGPISFGPKKWDTLYILDGTGYLRSNKFTLYRINCCYANFIRTSTNKKETFKDQIKNKRRPRITWSSLKKKVPYEIVFKGTIFDIIRGIVH